MTIWSVFQNPVTYIVAASTSKANTIESLPANKKSGCVCPLKSIIISSNLHASAGPWSENYARDSFEGKVDFFLL